MFIREKSPESYILIDYETLDKRKIVKEFKLLINNLLIYC